MEGAAVTKKKRSRSKITKPAKSPAQEAIASVRANIVAGYFICNYSGRITNKAVIIPGCAAAFANLPCAFKWLETICGEDTATCAGYKEVTAAAYGQTVNNIPVAFDRGHLTDFGGSQSFDVWMGPYSLWTHFTDERGLTVDAYNAQLKGVAEKVGRGKETRIHFDAGATVIAYNKKAAGCVKVTMESGHNAEEVEDGEVVVVETSRKNKGVSIEKAFQKFNTFIKTHAAEDGTARFVHECVVKDGFYANVLVSAGAEIAESEKLSNAIASKLVGATVYGPAVVIFTRKFSLKN